MKDTQFPFHRNGDAIYSNNSVPVCASADYLPEYKKCETDETWDETCAFIVRACNSHKKLVEALQFYMTICGNTAYMVDRENAKQAWKMANDAISIIG